MDLELGGTSSCISKLAQQHVLPSDPLLLEPAGRLEIDCLPHVSAGQIPSLAMHLLLAVHLDAGA
jgi:hypothetical protein